MVVDVAHYHFATNWFLHSELDRLLHAKRTVVSLHGADVHFASKRWGPDLLSRVFAQADFVTANSDFTANCAQSDSLGTRNIGVVRMGTDLDRLTFRRPVTPLGRPLHLLSVGRLVEKKGFSYGIEAVRLLSESGRKVKYSIVGDGPLEMNLQKLIEKGGLEDIVHLTGGASHGKVLDLMAESDILIAPSITSRAGDTEGQGMVLLEAMAVGLLVVATRHNGFPETVGTRMSGFLVPEGDSSAIFRRLVALEDDHDAWPMLAMQGRRHVEERFGLSEMVDKYLQIYQTDLPR